LDKKDFWVPLSLLRNGVEPVPYQEVGTHSRFTEGSKALSIFSFSVPLRTCGSYHHPLAGSCSGVVYLASTQPNSPSGSSTYNQSSVIAWTARTVPLETLATIA